MFIIEYIICEYMVSQVFTYVKTHYIVYFKYAVYAVSIIPQ